MTDDNSTKPAGEEQQVTENNSIKLRSWRVGEVGELGELVTKVSPATGLGTGSFKGETWGNSGQVYGQSFYLCFSCSDYSSGSESVSESMISTNDPSKTITTTTTITLTKRLPPVTCDLQLDPVAATGQVLCTLFNPEGRRAKPENHPKDHKV